MHTACEMTPVTGEVVGPSNPSLAFLACSNVNDPFNTSDNLEMNFAPSSLSTGSTQTPLAGPMAPLSHGDPLLPQFTSKHSLPSMHHQSCSFHAATSTIPVTSIGQPVMRGATPLSLHTHIRALKRRGRRMLRDLQALQQQIEVAERELWLAGNFGG